MIRQADLFWLPRPPDDFSALLRAAAAETTPLGPRLRQLASHALNINQLARLNKSMASAREIGRDLKPLVPFRLGILSNATTALIAPALVGTALRHGVALEVIEAPFNQIAQEALEPGSALAASRPDAILLALDVRGLALAPCPGNREGAEQTVAVAASYLRMICDGLKKNTGAAVIVQTLARLPEPDFGSYDIRLPGTNHWLSDRFNRSLVDTLADGDLLLDVASLSALVGLENWHDATQWNLARLPFAQDMVPLYADHLCRIIGALRGKSRRCLILDLDNTLWGGVIGDDGLEGIVLGQGDATGEAYLSVQRGALSLRDRGIVLAVSSKNDDAIARKPFREHADMLLRENHFAVFQANWTDKATNIRAIAETLSLGLDSMVLLDDNPAERAQVRRELPEVAVPELPSDAALYMRTLMSGGYFEAVTFSEDDRKRASYYKANAERIVLQGKVGNMDEYLASLDMTITFQPFDAPTRARITQLISKSNQFNLTTRRYSETDVTQLEEDQNVVTLQVRLADIFGDNGMISVVICRKRAETWDFDTWLMSCRVLGRGVEEAVLQEICRQAQESGVQRLVGRYFPTARNGMVAEHYGKLGFELVERSAGGDSIWQLQIGGAVRKALPMKIVRLP